MVLGSHKQSDTSRQLLNALYLLRSVTLEPGQVNYTTFELNPRLVTMIYSLLSIIIISPINLPFEVAPGRVLHWPLLPAVAVPQSEEAQTSHLAPSLQLCTRAGTPRIYLTPAWLQIFKQEINNYGQIFPLLCEGSFSRDRVLMLETITTFCQIASTSR